MKEKIKRILKFILFFIYTNAIYGLIVYFVFTWLAGYSLLAGYLGNLVLIILGLTIDANMYKMLQSKKLVKELKDDKNSEQAYRYIQNLLKNYISFKTALYLFYVIILVLSQVIVFYPTLFNENISHFIMANNYSILILIAFDMLSSQFLKDKERKKEIAGKLERALSEDDDSHLDDKV
jgi:hypothetical protein